MKSSRTQTEKKTKVTSVRLTDEQHNIVKQRAESKNMTVSNYLLDLAVHENDALTPQIIVGIQNIVNSACNVIEEYAPEKVVEMQGEVEKLWQGLK